MDFQFPETGISIAFYSMLVAVATVILCVILRKKNISSVKYGAITAAVTGLVVSYLLYDNHASGGEVTHWFGVGPPLLIVGLFATTMGQYKPEMSVLKSLGVFLLASPLVGAITWLFAYYVVAK